MGKIWGLAIDKNDRNCIICGAEMEERTVKLDGDVTYLSQALVCPRCGHECFTTEAVKKLEDSGYFKCGDKVIKR